MNTMPPRFRSAILGLCAAAVSAPGGSILASDDAGVLRTLIAADLSERTARVAGWDESVVVIVDEAGIERPSPREAIVAVLSPATGSIRAWPAPDADAIAGGIPIVVEFVDGARLFGSLGPWDSTEITTDAARLTDADGVGLLPLDGTPTRIALERIGRVLIDPWSRPTGAGGLPLGGDWSPGVEDELIFANGDRVTGFLVELGETLRFDAEGGERSFPIERVAEVRLGNPRESHDGTRLWLASGEILNGDGTEDGGFVESGPIAAAWLADGALVPLADLESGGVEPSGDRRWTRGVAAGSAWSAMLGAPDLALDGPTKLFYSLPPSARSFSGIARLGGTLDAPDAAPGRWADAAVAVRLQRGDSIETLATVPLTIGSPEALVAVDLPGVGETTRTLVIEVLEGRFGPIHDRVLLRRPFLISE